MSRKAAYMHFVDHEVARGEVRRPVAAPIEILGYDQGAIRIGVAMVRRFAPAIPPRDGASPRVEQDCFGEATMAGHRIVGPLDTKTVGDTFGVEFENRDGPHVANAEGWRHGNLS